MRVLHLTPYMHPAAGGPPIVVERLSAGLRERGHAVRVLTTALLCHDDGQELQESLSKSMDIAVLPIDRPRLAGLASSAPRAIDQSVCEADLVHLHGLWHPLNTLGRRACARYGRPYVMMPHGMLDPYSLRVRAIRKWLYLGLRERANLEGASRMLFTTETEEHLARSALPWLGPSDIIPLGAETFAPADRAVMAGHFVNSFREASGRRILLFLGRVHPKKGLERLVGALPKVISQTPDALLIIAGQGDKRYVSSLDRQVRSAGLEKHVLFTGMLSGDLKWGALAAAEAFVLPSQQENFAIAVAEAMLAGLPVVISDRVNISSDVTWAKAGIVIQNDRISTDLPDALLAVLGDRAAAARMGQFGRRMARVRYTWQSSAERVVDVYNAVLRSGS